MSLVRIRDGYEDLCGLAASLAQLPPRLPFIFVSYIAYGTSVLDETQQVQSCGNLTKKTQVSKFFFDFLVQDEMFGLIPYS